MKNNLIFKFAGRIPDIMTGIGTLGIFVTTLYAIIFFKNDPILESIGSFISGGTIEKLKAEKDSLYASNAELEIKNKELSLYKTKMETQIQRLSGDSHDIELIIANKKLTQSKLTSEIEKIKKERQKFVEQKRKDLGNQQESRLELQSQVHFIEYQYLDFIINKIWQYSYHSNESQAPKRMSELPAFMLSAHFQNVPCLEKITSTGVTTPWEIVRCAQKTAKSNISNTDIKTMLSKYSAFASIKKDCENMNKKIIIQNIIQKNTTDNKNFIALAKMSEFDRDEIALQKFCG